MEISLYPKLMVQLHPEFCVLFCLPHVIKALLQLEKVEERRRAARVIKVASMQGTAE